MTTPIVPVAIPSPLQPIPDPTDLNTWPARMAETHRWMREDAAPGMSALGDSAYANATAALEAATAAMAAANYAGAWSSLSGALAKGSSVAHAGSVWFLLVDLANVAASEPSSTNTDWKNLLQAASISFDPTSAGMTAVTVQAAIRDLARAIVDGSYLINGEMISATRGTSFPAVVDNQYTLDMWCVGKSNSAAITVSQAENWFLNFSGPGFSEVYRDFLEVLRAEVTTADTTISAGDYQTIEQRIVGRRARSLMSMGSSTGGPGGMSLGFWARSSKTGVHCVSFRNNAQDVSYVAEFNVPLAGQWKFYYIYVPRMASPFAITGSGWDLKDGVGLRVTFAMACGTTRQTTAGSWQTGNFLATANQVNLLDTVGGYLEITGVRLYPGTVALRYPYEDRASTRLKVAEWVRPVRVYQAGLTGTGILNGIGVPLQPPMAATPVESGTPNDISAGAIGARTVVLNSERYLVQATGNASGAFVINRNAVLSCEL